MRRFSAIGLAIAIITTFVGAPTDTSAKNIEMDFKAGTLVEVAFFKVRAGQEQALKTEYFPKALPIAMEYGARPLGTFNATRVEHGAALGIGTWGFFEWPSVERKKAFEQDPRFASLREFRDSLLETLPIQLYLEAKESVTVTLDSDKTYEAACAWVNPQNAALMDTYFAAAGPFIAEHGVRFLGDFKVIGQSDHAQYSFDSLPSAFFFVEWADVSAKEKWFGSETFKSVGWNRALAIDRLVIVESSINVPLP